MASRRPIQTIKIDRSFVKALHESGNVEIIRAIVSMAEAMAMNVTAEGVETEEQLAVLRDLSCGHGQGYLFDRPLAPDAVRALMARGDEPA